MGGCSAKRLKVRETYAADPVVMTTTVESFKWDPAKALCRSGISNA